MNKIAERLLKLINDNDVSYGELSKQTGIPKSAIQRYATGETQKIPITRIELLAKALHSNAAYLMGWDDNPESKSLNEQIVELMDDLTDEQKNAIIEFVKQMTK